MERRHSVFVGKLPHSFTKEIHDRQRNFSATMLINDDDSIGAVPWSATLAQIKGCKGVITARHAWEEARKHEFLLTLVGRGNYAFETKYLTPSVPEPIGVLNGFDVHVPDIGFIRLPESYATDLEAKGKAFFNLDKRLIAKSYFPDMTEGYWTVFGNPNEWLETDKKKVSSFVYGTGVSKQFEESGWDYCVMNLDIPSNPEIPRDLSGLSGGGIWWTRWGCDETLERFVVANPFEDMILAGVSFFQTGSQKRLLLGHGPKSIYEQLYQHVLKTL
ncbi:MAG: hypothetical protein K9M96_04060 [Deltaproteobacteria bacterium]|nr:hypothetical protein [Deltaproteobacteria bacterium]